MFRNYIKTAFRQLSRNKMYTAINIFGLGLGIASALVIFTLVSYHLSYDTHHTKADQTYRIITDLHFENIIRQPGVPNPFAPAFREDFPEIKEVTAYFGYGSDLVTIEENGQEKSWEIDEAVMTVEPSFFDIFNAKFIAGTPSVLEEPYKVVLSQTAAKKIFGDENALGKKFKHGMDFDVQVEGIVEDGPENSDYSPGIYISYATHLAETDKSQLGSWGSISSSHQVCMVLPKSMNPEQINTRLRGFADKHIEVKPEVHEFRLQALNDIHFNPDYEADTSKSVIYALILIALFLIGIACINFVNMATAQAINRSKEIGVRKAIGGSRTQLFVQFMSETAVIVTFSMLLAVFLAKIALPTVSDITDINLQLSLITEPLNLLYLFGLGLLITFIAGAYPAQILSGFRPVRALKGGINTQTLGGFNLRRALVITQFAVCQFMILSLLVVNNQMDYIKEADLGFKTEGIVSIPNPDTDYAKSQALQHELEQITGIQKTSLHWDPPTAFNNNSTSSKIEGKTENEDWSIHTKVGDANYIDMFGLQLLAGENYRQADTTNGFLINETALKLYGYAKPEEILGKRLELWGKSAPIVGVLKNFHIHSLEHEIRPVVLLQEPHEHSTIALNIDLANTESTLAQIEKVWKKHNPNGYFYSNFYDENIARFYESEAALLQMMRFFCGVALFIACFGLYGLVSFMATRRRKEIGVRKVLGASVAQILGIFGKEFSMLMLFGFAIAAPLAYFAMSGWLSDYAYRISMGLSIFLVGIVATAVLTFLTVGWQSSKAALQHPSESLRSE